MAAQLVRISDAIEVFCFTYQGQPVLTFSQIDTLHVRPEGTSSAAFRRNRKRFLDGEDFHVLESESLDVWRREFPEAVGANAPSLTLITESGYLMLVKPFTDDRSWQIQRQLVKLYFRVKKVVEQPAPRPTISAEQWQAIRSLVHWISVCCKFQSRAEHAAYERIRFAYGLRHASELRPEDFEEVKADLKGLGELAKQHQDRMCALDEEFIAAVVRPPVSIRKVRALAQRQAKQPPLTF